MVLFAQIHQVHVGMYRRTDVIDLIFLKNDIPSMKKMTEYEVLTDPSFSRHHIGDPYFNDIYDIYVKTRSSQWNEGKFKKELAVDEQNKNKLPADSLRTLKKVLGFFVCGDGIVNSTINTELIPQFTHKEIEFMYGEFMTQENVHNICYTMLCKSYASNIQDYNDMLEAVENNLAIKGKADWNKKYKEKEHKKLAYLIISNVILEGLFFPSSFAYIFSLQEMYPSVKLPGLQGINDAIQKDEINHWNAGFVMYSKVLNRLTQSEMFEMMGDALVVEKKFIDDMFEGVKYNGMNADLMKEYVEYVADELLIGLGYPKFTESQNPFGWMIRMNINIRITDFFVRTSTEYNLPTEEFYTSYLPWTSTTRIENGQVVL
jgi:ribonucleotide reductase beta subunit family protein with ferritin-like domain